MISDDTLLAVSLRVDYPNKLHALKDVSFIIHRGEVLGWWERADQGKAPLLSRCSIF